MKNYLLLCCLAMAASLSFTSCEKNVLTDGSEDETTESTETKSKAFTFKVKGDFGSPAFTRSAQTVQESQMTDLWLLDYVDGAMVQQKHLLKTDAEWQSPAMTLTYGQHHIYIIAAAGDTPTLSTESKTITWTKPRDTFYKDYAVEVKSTSSSSRSVTLERVSTLFRLKLTDEIPASLSTIAFTPSVWYYGINYVTGEPVSSGTSPISASIPSSYAGTTGSLNVSFYGIGASAEYTTDMAINAKSADGTVLSTATITAAPMQRNRATEYSGAMFHQGNAMAVNLNADWAEPYEGNF